MGDLIAEGAKEGLNLLTSATKGFLVLLGIGVGAVVVKFGAETVLSVIGTAVGVIKTAITVV